MPDPGEGLVGVSKAAEALGVNKSTMSRYVSSNPELNHASPGQSPLVYISEVRNHRGDNVNEAKSGNYAGRLLGEDDDPVSPPPANGERRSRSMARAAIDEVTAELKRLELDRELGKVVDADGVRRAQSTVARRVRDAILTACGTAADQIVALPDPRDHRAAKAAITTVMKQALASIAEAASAWQDEAKEERPTGT